MRGLRNQPQQQTLLMCDEAQLRTVITDTIRDVMKQAKAEAEAAKEMATMTSEEVAKLFNVTKSTMAMEENRLSNS